MVEELVGASGWEAETAVIYAFGAFEVCFARFKTRLRWSALLMG